MTTEQPTPDERPMNIDRLVRANKDRQPGQWFWPRFYRYRVSDPGLRAMWNRYEGPMRTTIGAAVVVGSYAYCVMWRTAR